MLVPPRSGEGVDGGGGGSCPVTAACCGTMRYICRAVSAVDRGKGGGCSQVGDALMTGRIQNRGWQKSDTWCRGWRWKGVETFVQYVSRLDSALVEVGLLVLKKISSKKSTLL